LIFAPVAAAIFGGLSTFVAGRMWWILAGLGVGFATMKGMQTVAGFIISDMQLAVSGITTAAGWVMTGGGGGSVNVGLFMVKFAAFCGLFDALNIMIGGFMALYGLIGMRVILRRLT
jgi:hypothetical protein